MQAHLPEESYGAGEVIVAEGATGTSAYVILEGRVEVFKTVNRLKVSLRVLGKGEVFGEMGIIDHGARSAAVAALDRVRVAVVPEGEFRRLLASMPLAMQYILDTLIERLRHTSTRLAEIIDLDTWYHSRI